MRHTPKRLVPHCLAQNTLRPTSFPISRAPPLHTSYRDPLHAYITLRPHGYGLTYVRPSAHSMHNQITRIFITTDGLFCPPGKNRSNGLQGKRLHSPMKRLDAKSHSPQRFSCCDPEKNLKILLGLAGGSPSCSFFFSTPLFTAPSCSH